MCPKIGVKNAVIGVMSVMLFFTGCSSKVDQVKDGTFHDYPTTTIGKAFDASFANANWKEATTAKGVQFVEFNGTIDLDFLEVIAEGFLKDYDVANPLAQYEAKSRCLGEETGLFTKGIDWIFGGLALASDRVKASASFKADVIPKLAEKSKKLKVQFLFNEADKTQFLLGYYGMEGSDWQGCEINKYVKEREFLNFVYSNHVYNEYDYKGIAKGIVDDAESVGVLPDTNSKEITGNPSAVRKRLILNAISKDERVVKRKADIAAAEVEMKKRRAEEAAAQIKAMHEANLKEAMAEIFPVFKNYRSLMLKWVKDCDGNCSDYPYWDVIGFNAPKSKHFEFDGENTDYSWYVSMKTKKEDVGIECYYYMNCANVTDKCECSVSEDCKDFSPNLSSVCKVEYN